MSTLRTYDWSDTLRKFGDEYKAQMLARQKAQGFYASGRSHRSIKQAIFRGGTETKIVGASYFAAQAEGNPPRARSLNEQPPAWFVRAISDWIRVKSINRNPYSTAKSLWNRGDRVFRKERAGLDLSAVANEALRLTIREVAFRTVELTVNEFKQT